MKKVLFGIFAHPDDEAFGPAGTLLKLASEGYDIHLILLTKGEAGVNPDNEPDLGATRLKEWQQAAKVVGARSTHALHYPDGALEKIPLNELGDAVETIIKEVLDTYSESFELSFMTFEPQGLTGHQDHITTSQVTTKLASRFNTYATWYFCLDSSQAPLQGTAYYEPRAREDNYITDRIDVSAWLASIYDMIDAHVSQREDGAKRKSLGHERLSVECFRIEY